MSRGKKGNIKINTSYPIYHHPEISTKRAGKPTLLSSIMILTSEYSRGCILLPVLLFLLNITEKTEAPVAGFTDTQLFPVEQFHYSCGVFALEYTLFQILSPLMGNYFVLPIAIKDVRYKDYGVFIVTLCNIYAYVIALS